MTQPCLELRHLQAAYGERVVLDDISLTLAKGEWFVLLGPNGCGKSTLLDCVAGRKTPSAGSIEICGHSLTNDSVAAKMRMGYGCAPEVLPPLLTARQCLEIHAAAKRLSSVGEDLLELADELRFTPYWDSFVDILSLGTRQKLAVLLALVGDPKLILLDEAFNGLDPESAQILKRNLRTRLISRGATLLLATHSLDIVEHHADRAALLVDGRLQRIWEPSDLAQLRSAGQRFDDALARSMRSGTACGAHCSVTLKNVP
jgi:ABC-2 type transport system ATP-binding protein